MSASNVRYEVSSNAVDPFSVPIRTAQRSTLKLLAIVAGAICLVLFVSVLLSVLIARHSEIFLFYSDL